MPFFYQPNPKRYDGRMTYRRCGASGLLLPAISLGLWHNFGDGDCPLKARRMLRTAFDAGVTHFDLANNYGPPAGSAETNFGELFHQDFGTHRDELVISTKAGYHMWDGPYGEWGSRKHMRSSLDASLKRMGLEYVDIFYHHRPDPNTPLEETMMALNTAVQQGKALYVGVSNYPAELAAQAFKILRDLGTPCVVHQPRYSMLDRTFEAGLANTLAEHSVGCVTYSPLAQGLLSSRYLDGIPAGSRADKESGFLQKEQVESSVKTIQSLNSIAKQRGQTLSQMALAWNIAHPVVTSTLVGASSVEQLKENLGCLDNLSFSTEELNVINAIV